MTYWRWDCRCGAVVVVPSMLRKAAGSRVASIKLAFLAVVMNLMRFAW